MKESRRAHILLAEDSEIDIKMTSEALNDCKIPHTLHVVRDGVAATQFLRRQAPFDNALRPDLVLLDLNMPKKDGHEVLSEIKGDAELKSIPVIVLTTSNSESDIVQSYDLHGNCYITKPVDMLQFIEAVKSISEFWLSVAALPPKTLECSPSKRPCLFSAN